MDRLKAETGADPIQDPNAQIGGDEQNEATAASTADPAGVGPAVPPDPEDDLLSGSAPKDETRLEP